MPASVDGIPMPPGWSPIRSRAIEARFDAALMSSDGGLLALREIELGMGRAIVDHPCQSWDGSWPRPTCWPI